MAARALLKCCFLSSAAAILMVLVAIDAVVDIPANPLVILVGFALGMAIGTCKDGIIVRIGVTSGTNAARAAVVHIPPGMVEGGIEPGVGVVTRLACRREMRGGMVGVGRFVIVGRMARIAKGGSDVVVAIDVAIRALPRRNSVLASQRPSGLRVVEGSIHPVDGVMTGLAGRGKLCRDVIDRSFRVVVIVLVATHTTGIGDVVVVVDVAVGALPGRDGVLAGQSPSGRRVVEGAIHPVSRVVA